jgi:hypothetical protein
MVHIFSHKPTRATIRRLWLGNDAVNSPSQTYRLCFLCGPCRGVINGHSQKMRPSRELQSSQEVKGRASRPSLAGYEPGSKGIELSWQLQNTGKKGIRL